VQGTHRPRGGNVQEPRSGTHPLGTHPDERGENEEKETKVDIVTGGGITCVTPPIQLPSISQSCFPSDVY
jgi:hypothetical protein